MAGVYANWKAALGALLVSSVICSANAAEVRLSYHEGSYSESFDLNTAAGSTNIVSGNVLYFDVTDDSNGNTAFLVGPPGALGYSGNLMETGNLNVQSHEFLYDAILGGIVYDGVHPVLEVAPGDVYATYLGGTLSVSSVPETSTWAMFLAGFGALGLAGYRRGFAKAA